MLDVCLCSNVFVEFVEFRRGDWGGVIDGWSCFVDVEIKFKFFERLINVLSY